ncbi:MAG: EVE domain-containing protein, partial [Nitrospinae bacterium]|nr:EVE domain-containing protein [Nitrospinota bacterium]
MTERRYWLTLISRAGWARFMAGGARALAYSKRRWRETQKIAPGDRLLIYHKDESGFVAVAEASGAPYLDDTPIVPDEFLPGRVPVILIAALDADRTINAVTLKDRLSIFNDPDPNAWTDWFRNSPLEWSAYDGAVVTRAVMEAARGGAEDLKTYASPLGDVTAPLGDVEPSVAMIEIAGLLATLGARAGYEVWLAPPFRGRAAGGGLMSTLPETLDGAARATLELSHVAWFGGHAARAVFELEHTPALAEALLRLADVAALIPGTRGSVLLAAPEALRRGAVEQANRPAFAALIAAARFVSFEAIRESADAAALLERAIPMRW